MGGASRNSCEDLLAAGGEAWAGKAEDEALSVEGRIQGAKAPSTLVLFGGL